MASQLPIKVYMEIVQQAIGRELRKGPRGGGRDLDEIVQHV